MKTVAIMNQKGGTGKTTSAINLAGELAARRERVLLVDTDTQGNATSNLQLTEVPAATLTDVICGKGPSLADAVCRTSVEGLDLIRGGTLLAPALVAMQELRFGRDTVLRRLLPQIPDTYDYVFFDCSPSLESLFNINVLMAVQYILIPIKVDKNSIEGYDVMLETVREVRAGGNPDLRALGIFMTAVETGSSLDREMIANLPALLPELAFKAYIRKNIDVKKAPIALLPCGSIPPAVPPPRITPPWRTRCWREWGAEAWQKRPPPFFPPCRKPRRTPPPSTASWSAPSRWRRWRTTP